jgi:hypothetical protein
LTQAAAWIHEVVIVRCKKPYKLAHTGTSKFTIWSLKKSSAYLTAT